MTSLFQKRCEVVSHYQMCDNQICGCQAINHAKQKVCSKSDLISSIHNGLSMQKLGKDATSRPYINSWTIICGSKQQLRRSVQTIIADILNEIWSIMNSRERHNICLYECHQQLNMGLSLLQLLSFLNE